MFVILGVSGGLQSGLLFPAAGVPVPQFCPCEVGTVYLREELSERPGATEVAQRLAHLTLVSRGAWGHVIPAQGGHGPCPHPSGPEWHRASCIRPRCRLGWGLVRSPGCPRGPALEQRAHSQPKDLLLPLQTFALFVV